MKEFFRAPGRHDDHGGRCDSDDSSPKFGRCELRGLLWRKLVSEQTVGTSSITILVPAK
jgi:hypothetical protein